MPKRHDEKSLAPITGFHTLTINKHKCSPKYEVRDRNMRLCISITWRPFHHEVPEGGSVWELMYGQKVEKFITLEELSS